MAGDYAMGELRLETTELIYNETFRKYFPKGGGTVSFQFDWSWAGDDILTHQNWRILISPDPVFERPAASNNDRADTSSGSGRVGVSAGLERPTSVSDTVDRSFGSIPVKAAWDQDPSRSSEPTYPSGTYYLAAWFTGGPLDDNESNNFSNPVQITLSGGPSGSGNGGPTQPSAEVRTAFAANTDAANGLSAAYHVLLGGVPNEAGFVSLINSAVSTNFGAGPGPVFNTENIFINLINNLVQGNQTAEARFDAIATGTTLQEKITSIYQALVPPSKQTAEGLAFLTSAQNIAFYQGVAAERGVAGTDGAAIVAMASLLKIVVGENIGVGNAINDLAQAVAAGNAALPASGSTFTDIEVADGTAFDADDAAAIARMAAAAEPAPFAYADDGGGLVSDHEGHNVQLSGTAVAAGDGLFLT